MRWWWQLRKSESDLEREVRSDLELEEEEQQEKGLPPKEAGRQACLRQRSPYQRTNT